VPDPSPRSNADRFLAAFRRIEDLLGREPRGARRSFGEMLDGSSRPAVQHFRRELRDLQELRNAIVHRSTNDGRPIAEPHPEAVALIETIAERIAVPPPALLCAGEDVLMCRPGDDVGEAAMRMRREGLSVMPVVDDGACVGLLTTHTITRWLAAGLERGHGLLETRRVREVLAHAEHPDDHAFLSQEASAYDAIRVFRLGLESGRTPRAVVITATGGERGAIRGILTPADVPRLLEVAGTLG
jgi:CBS domain-containing protein